MIREQLKAWCSRRLNEQQAAPLLPESELRTHWWGDRGSIRWIFTEADLAAAIQYVRYEQDNPRRFMKSIDAQPRRTGKPDA